MIDLWAAWRCGSVRRWHCHGDHRLRESGDTDSAHSHRAALLALALFPDRPEVMRTLLLHDLGESGVCGGVGDVPNPFKERSPTLALAMAEAEEAAMRSIGITLERLTASEAEMVRLCDKLDAYLWMLDRAPDLARLDGWRRDFANIARMADRLGVTDAVATVLADAQPLGPGWPLETMGGDDVVVRD